MADHTARPRTADDLFGERVAAVRRLRGWSQSELSRQVAAVGNHIPQTAVSKIEMGTRTVSLTEALLLCDVLRVGLDEMVRPGAVEVVTVR